MQVGHQQAVSTVRPQLASTTRFFLTIVTVVLVVAAIAYGGIVISNAVGSHAASAADPFQATSAFRAGERAALPITPATSMALNNAFRAGERGDGIPSSASLYAQFRAGERGDAASPSR